MSPYQHRRPRVFLLALLLCCSLVAVACGTDPGSGGINSAPGITDRFSAVTVHPFSLASATVSCQANEQMLSGGWAVNTPGYRQDKVARGGRSFNVLDNYFIAASYPASANAWTVTFTNQAVGAGQGDVLGVVHVECLSKGKASVIVNQSGNAQSGNTLAVNCPQGTKITGGGYRLTNITQSNLAASVIDFESSQPIGITRWMVSTDYSIGTLNAFGNNVVVYGVCSSNLNVTIGNSATISAPSAQQPYAATSATGQASCPAGQTPLGAGYRKSNFDPRAFPVTLFYPSYSTSTQNWDATVYALPPITIDSASFTRGGKLNVQALCAVIAG